LTPPSIACFSFSPSLPYSLSPSLTLSLLPTQLATFVEIPWYLRSRLLLVLALGDTTNARTKKARGVTTGIFIRDVILSYFISIIFLLLLYLPAVIL